MALNSVPFKERIFIPEPCFLQNTFSKTYSVYTDGSKINESVGFSVVIFEGAIILKTFCFKLSSFNSVFQAELAAINFAVGWARENNVFINIYTDSLSSMQVVEGTGGGSSFVFEVKKNLIIYKKFFKLNWVKAHNENLGNEVADRFAKIAAFLGDPMYIPIPYSRFKLEIKKRLFDCWTSAWSNSSTGSHTRKYVGTPGRAPVFNKYLIYFLTGHGPFPAYLCRFNLRPTPNCPCNDDLNFLGDPEHYAFDCSLTANFHLCRPAIGFEDGWFKSVLKNAESIGRLTKCIKIAFDLTNS